MNLRVDLQLYEQEEKGRRATKMEKWQQEGFESFASWRKATEKARRDAKKARPSLPAPPIAALPAATVTTPSSLPAVSPAEVEAGAAVAEALDMMAGLTSILPSPPNKAARQTGDALPPPAESELTTGRQHIKHTMDVNTSGGQRHGEASYKVRVSSPVGESFDARAARLGAENKRKQRSWSRAHALAYEQREATRGSESDSEGDSLHLHPTPPHPIPCH